MTLRSSDLQSDSDLDSIAIFAMVLPRGQITFDFLFDVLLTFFGIFCTKFCVSALGRSLPKQGEVSRIYMKAAKQPPDASTRGERPNGKNGQFQAPSTSASSNLRD